MVVTIYFRTVQCYTCSSVVAANYVSTLECGHWLAAPSIGKGKGAKGKTCHFGISISLLLLQPTESKLNAKLIVCDSKWL